MSVSNTTAEGVITNFISQSLNRSFFFCDWGKLESQIIFVVDVFQSMTTSACKKLRNVKRAYS